MNNEVITADHLTKIFREKQSLFSRKYHEKLALIDLNLKIASGQSVAFLGENGAGKSTAIKLLSGILKPTSGSCSIAGYQSGTIEANREIGLIFGTRSQLWSHLTVAQSLSLIAEIYNVYGKEKNYRISELSELFDIVPFHQSRASALSLGQRMRCEVVCALLHYPKILLADEPTIGLDIVSKFRFRQLLREWQQEKNTTLLVTSHDCGDLDYLCDRAILIKSGVKYFDGGIQELKYQLSNKRQVVVTMNHLIDEKEVFTGSISPDMFNIFIDAYKATFEIDISRIAVHDAIQKICTAFKEKIVDIEIPQLPLEAVVKQIYEEANVASYVA